MKKPKPIPENQLVGPKQVAECRERFVEEQGGLCALCGHPILPEDRVHLDHAHKGKNIHHARGALHAGCNILQGKIENSVTLNRITPDRLQGIFERYQGYVDADYSGNPLYPKKKRKARAKRKQEQ